uniref:Uncharacterized protein n=1 Tax=Amphilophus citrinellus TaxID=61819 RepID=A0A3Q0T284_AMPCI
LQGQKERLGMATCLAVCKMASLCKRQQCTIERRGFRQELDSWRHKLIHCVGFESILEGLFGPGLVKDITLFQGKHAQQTNLHLQIQLYTNSPAMVSNARGRLS